MEHDISETMTAKDIFVRSHLAILQEAITRMAPDKYGLALSINAIIMPGVFSEAILDNKVGWFIKVGNINQCNKIASPKFKDLSTDTILVIFNHATINKYN